MRGFSPAIGIAALAFIAVASPAAAAPEEGWAPEPIPSLVMPTENTTLSAWERYKVSRGKPSVDQHLDDPVLHGAIDLHAHFGPDTYNRQWDAFDIARRAQARGMRGIVLKSHWTHSADLAELAHKYAAPDMEVWGALVLNSTVGGINPMAVRAFAETSGGKAKVVWLPTHDSEYEVHFLKDQRPYVRVSEDGKLLPQLLEVLDLIKKYDLTLATGHVKPEELLQIVDAAKERGITRIIITHPELGLQFGNATIEQVEQAVKASGAYAEVVANELFRPTKDKSIAMIRKLGPEHCVISTDSGITGTANHTDALVRAANVLREAGFSEADLNLMFKANPAKVLGLALQ